MSATKSSPKLEKSNAAGQLLLRRLPSVDDLVNRPGLADTIARAGREMVIQAAREALAEIRASAAQMPARNQSSGLEEADAAEARVAGIENEIASRLARQLSPSLRRVINATGVVLHTNLGRAPLSRDAAERILRLAQGYTNLEYDLGAGERGKRDMHTNALLARLTGAEAAIVVNNNAAAVLLTLNTLAKSAEVIVSRGELIEIGDGFRIPDIMSESGAELREVGTTNRTCIADYERAIGERTRLLLRVHPSNFKIVGFAKRPELDEIVALGRKKRIPVFEDLGSGCLADLSSEGVAEPLVRHSIETGVDVVTFSGDKLLGGPQAGIIAGKKEIIARIRRNPLFRALRVDKLTIAALEATLRSYLRGALDEIPTLHMIRMNAEEIERRARAFIGSIRNAIPGDCSLEIRKGFSVIGGGSTPEQKLPTALIAVQSACYSAAELEERLRKPLSGSADSRTPRQGAASAAPSNQQKTGALAPEARASGISENARAAEIIPVVARIERKMLLLDLRTVLAEEESALRAALVAALT